MDLNFTIKYDSGLKDFDGLDHYYGSQSLFGLSQILLISLNAFFNKDIITQAPSAKGFRLVLGHSRRGSWEQAISLVITDPAVAEAAKDLGKNALYDLLKWSLLSGVGGKCFLKYRKSIKRARELERENDDLQEKLDEALKRVHAPVKYQGLTVQVMSGRTILANFDDMTLQYLETEMVSDDDEIIECAISRFNARTGTGRLIDSLKSASTPFFPIENLRKSEKLLLAKSPSEVVEDKYSPVKLLVTRVTDAGGKTKRFRLRRVMAA